MPQQFKALGNKVTEGDLEVVSLTSHYLDERTAKYWGGINTSPITTSAVKFVCDEVTALCPVTGQPDQYTVTIELGVNGFSLESKSLKLYLQKYRNEGIFCEDFAAKICFDVVRYSAPRYCYVTIEQKPRGGIAIRATSTYTGTAKAY
jgi:7-cyano-7-deazaguanine reductase